MKKLFFFVLLFSVGIFGQYKYLKTVTIASGDTMSSLIVLDYNTIAGISFPSAMTGTSLKIYTSNDTTASTFKQVMYDGNAVTITVTLGMYNQLVPSQTWGLLRYAKLVSSSAETSNRTLLVHIKP